MTHKNTHLETHYSLRVNYIRVRLNICFQKRIVVINLNILVFLMVDMIQTVCREVS